MMKNEITYKKPVRIMDKPVATLWITQLKKLRWEIYTEFRCNGTLCASAVQNGCFVDIATGRPALVPRQLLEPYQKELESLSEEDRYPPKGEEKP